MYNDVEDLYFQIKREMSYCESIIASCERCYDIDGIMYYSGELHAYSCLLDCVNDILKTAEFRTHCGA